MKRQYRPYPEYKDSGVEWLGEIPAHWDVAPAIAHLRKTGKTITPDSINAEMVFLYSIPSVQETGNGEVVEKRAVDSGKLLIGKPCLLVSKLNPRKGTIVLAQPKEIPTLSSTEFVALAPKDSCVLRFAEYVYRSEGVRQYLDSTVESATRSHQRTKPDFIAKVKWCWPPLPEQRAIAAFLDRETARIDALIARKRELIDLLRRQRTAVISHAVTKGLDPSAPLKDSGVEWLGQIPAHWDVRRLKFVAPPVNVKFSEKPPEKLYLGLENIESGTGKILFDSLSENVESTVSAFQPGDVLFGKLRPYLAKVVHADFDGVCTTELLVLRPIRQVVKGRFLFYLLLSHNFISIIDSMTYGAKMPRANATQIGNLPANLPPLPEQRAIAAFLDCETTRIDRLIGEIEESIALLQRQRTALISAAVTGKIDVREQR